VNGRLTLVALAALLAACGRAGEPLLWIATRDTPRILALRPSGLPVRLAAEPPVIDTPVRALLARRDGAVVVLQEPETCAGGALDLVADACLPASAPRVAVAPVLLLTPLGGRLATFPAADGGGAPLFTAAAPPWAAAEDAAGRVWVTGRTAPVVYAPGGALALAAEALAFPTRGVAALPDGRVVVSYGVADLAVYDAAGTVTLRLTEPLGPDHDVIDGLAADGADLLVATRRFGVSSAAIVLRVRLEGTTLVSVQDAALSAALPGGVPSALAVAAGRVITSPALGRLAPAACGRWLSSDLRADLGGLAGAPHRAVAWIR
jgi:hypothetical protein